MDRDWFCRRRCYRISCRTLLAEGVALQRLWRTPGFIVAFYVPPWLDSRASKHPWLVFLLWLPFAVDWLILFSAFCALAVLVSGGLPIL